MSNWAVFIDRDGTINHDSGYLVDPEGLRLLPMVAEAIKLLNKAGARLIIVSNQSGVARGFFSEEDVRRFNQRLEEELLAQGAIVDAFYFCPHHPGLGEGPYRIDCQCRKPKPGLLLQAAEEHEVDLSYSYLIGDKMSDVEAGTNAGCRAILVLTSEEEQDHLNQAELNVSPSYIAQDLYEATQWIITDTSSREKRVG